MILVLIITYILQGIGIPEAQMLWAWFGDHLFWTIFLLIVFFA